MFKLKNKKRILEGYELTHNLLRIEDYLYFIATCEELCDEDKSNSFLYLGRYLGQDKYISPYAFDSNKNKIVLILNKDKTIIEKINL